MSASKLIPGAGIVISPRGGTRAVDRLAVEFTRLVPPDAIDAPCDSAGRGDYQPHRHTEGPNSTKDIVIGEGSDAELCKWEIGDPIAEHRDGSANGHDRLMMGSWEYHRPAISRTSPSP